MLAGLLNTPQTDNDWAWFSWQNRLSHDKIRSAILKQYKQNLVDYQTDPIDLNALDLFLNNNANLHTDMNGVLKLPSLDLLDVDIKDKNQVDAWLYYHWKEHSDAETKLGIGS